MADQDVSNMINFELEDMFSYSLVPIIISLIVFLALAIIYYHFFLRKPKQPFQYKPRTGKEAIKKTYIGRLDEIIAEYQARRIDERKVYIRLSRLIRGFAFEMTGVKLQNCTLQDISMMDMPQLYNLVYEYYDPEFAKYSKGHSPIVTNNSLMKTRSVIQKWI